MGCRCNGLSIKRVQIATHIMCVSLTLYPLGIISAPYDHKWNLEKNLFSNICSSSFYTIWLAEPIRHPLMRACVFIGKFAVIKYNQQIRYRKYLREIAFRPFINSFLLYPSLGRSTFWNYQCIICSAMLFKKNHKAKQEQKNKRSIYTQNQPKGKKPLVVDICHFLSSWWWWDLQ